jgi:ABC-type branched-subunit amino acid transport system substrate-binding protein
MSAQGKAGVRKSVVIGSVIVALLIGASGMYAVLYALTPSTTSKEICSNNVCVLGGMRDMSGVNGALGLPGKVAQQLAVQDLNTMLAAAGNPTRFSITVNDAASDPTAALTQLQNLAASGVTVCICADSSGEVSNMLSYANQHHILIIAISTSVALSYADRGYLYRMAPDDAIVSPGLAQVMAKNGVTDLITVYRNDPFGSGAATATNTAFKALGGSVVDSIAYSPVSSGAYDFTSILGQMDTDYQSAVSSAGATHVAIDGIGFAEIAVMLQQAKSLYPDLLNAVWYSSDSAPGNTNYITGDGSLQSQVKLIGTTWNPENTTKYQDFVSRVKAQTGGAYNFYAAGDYDGTWIAGLSILACGSMDATCVKNIYPTIAAGTYGVVGPVDLNQFGDLVAHSQSVWEVNSVNGAGQWQVVGSVVGSTVTLFSNYES